MPLVTKRTNWHHQFCQPGWYYNIWPGPWSICHDSSQSLLFTSSYLKSSSPYPLTLLFITLILHPLHFPHWHNTYPHHQWHHSATCSCDANAWRRSRQLTSPSIDRWQITDEEPPSVEQETRAMETREIWPWRPLRMWKQKRSWRCGKSGHGNRRDYIDKKRIWGKSS